MTLVYSTRAETRGRASPVQLKLGMYVSGGSNFSLHYICS